MIGYDLYALLCVVLVITLTACALTAKTTRVQLIFTVFVYILLVIAAVLVFCVSTSFKQGYKEVVYTSVYDWIPLAEETIQSTERKTRKRVIITYELGCTVAVYAGPKHLILFSEKKTYSLPGVKCVDFIKEFDR